MLEEGKAKEVEMVVEKDENPKEEIEMITVPKNVYVALHNFFIMHEQDKLTLYETLKQYQVS